MPSIVSKPSGMQYRRANLFLVTDLGVIVAALIIWKFIPQNPNRFYADPAVSLVISLIIFASAVPMSELSRT